MVSYTLHPVKQRGFLNDYWKLEDLRGEIVADLKVLLRERNYCFVTSSKRSRLLQLLSRQTRGLLSYDGCRADESTKFCVNRGLLIFTNSKLWKAANIKLLESADDETVFENFMNLPPELRVIVYTQYFRSLPELVYPVQPPLARISRVVRSESISLFYRTCHFIMRRRALDALGTRLYPTSGKMLHGHQTLTLFDAMGEDYLNMIRNLSIDVYGERVEWSNGKTRILASSGEEEDKPLPLSTLLLRFLKGIDCGASGKGLTRNDVKQINKMIAGGPFQLSSV